MVRYGFTWVGAQGSAVRGRPVSNRPDPPHGSARRTWPTRGTQSEPLPSFPIWPPTGDTAGPPEHQCNTAPGEPSRAARIGPGILGGSPVWRRRLPARDRGVRSLPPCGAGHVARRRTGAVNAVVARIADEPPASSEASNQPVGPEKGRQGLAVKRRLGRGVVGTLDRIADEPGIPVRRRAVQRGQAPVCRWSALPAAKMLGAARAGSSWAMCTSDAVVAISLRSISTAGARRNKPLASSTFLVIASAGS
jgi:hypothetical protein